MIFSVFSVDSVAIKNSLWPTNESSQITGRFDAG